MFQVCKTKLRIALDRSYILFKLTNFSNKTVWDKGLQLRSAEERSDDCFSSETYMAAETRQHNLTLKIPNKDLPGPTGTPERLLFAFIPCTDSYEALWSSESSRGQNCRGRDETFMVRPKKSHGRPWRKPILWQWTSDFWAVRYLSTGKGDPCTSTKHSSGGGSPVQCREAQGFLHFPWLQPSMATTAILTPRNRCFYTPTRCFKTCYVEISLSPALLCC